MPTIRPATVGDIPLLIGLMREFYGEANYELDAAWATRTFSALFSEPAHGAVWLAMDGDVPAGYIVLTQRFSMEFGGLDGFIDDLFVRPTHRRRGFANALMIALLSECERRGILALHVETSAENPAAVKVYQRHGLADRQRLLLTRRLTYRQETVIAPKG